MTHNEAKGITFYVFYCGIFHDTLGPHWGLREESAAADKYRKLHPEMNWSEIRVSRHAPRSDK